MVLCQPPVSHYSCSDTAIAKLATSKGIRAAQQALLMALNSPGIGHGAGPANLAASLCEGKSHLPRKLAILFCAALAACLAYPAPVRAAADAPPSVSANLRSVKLRKFPYPYRAMLAIESDADHTDLRKFNIVHEFLNTRAETPLGRGLGLDVADSFFLYNGSNIPAQIDYRGQRLNQEMTFFKGTSRRLNDGAILLHYIRAGWIDTLHSMGDFSRIGARGTLFSRSLAQYALHYLERRGVRISVFTDHGNQSNTSNFGAYGINPFDDYQQGDNPASPYFVTDLLRKEGVRFVWADLFRSQYSYGSMLYPIRLRDGRTMWGFWRFTGTLKIERVHRLWKYDWTDLWNPDLLARQLSPNRLRELVRTRGYTIIATHLEGNANRAPLSTGAVEALTRLAHMQDHGEILVARTSRLLQYNLVQQFLRYRTYLSHGNIWIDVEYVADPVDGAFVPTLAQLHGITFQVNRPGAVRLAVRGTPVPAAWLQRSARTVGVRWYRPDTYNYAVWNAKQLVQHPSVQSHLLAPALFAQWRMFVVGLLGAAVAGFLLILLRRLARRNIRRARSR